MGCYTFIEKVFVLATQPIDAIGLRSVDDVLLVTASLLLASDVCLLASDEYVLATP